MYQNKKLPEKPGAFYLMLVFLEFTLYIFIAYKNSIFKVLEFWILKH